jgi:hypothetical protein
MAAGAPEKVANYLEVTSKLHVTSK